MNTFPTITSERQKLYESIFLSHSELKNDIPCICGYYGRACRKMNTQANSRLCNGCSLSLFVSTAEAILERCTEKENMGIQHLYDSDILDIQEKLKNKGIKVECSYIECILNSLT